MEHILSIYHDCDTFSLSLAKQISSVSTKAKEQLADEFKASEKERMREYYNHYQTDEDLKKLADYDTLFDEVFSEAIEFYAQFEGKEVHELIAQKVDPFLCDYVGKTTKYDKPFNFFWHLYHTCQNVIMNSDSLKGLPVDNGFEDKVFKNDFNKPLKPHLQKVEYTYSSHCTVGPLQLVYYFSLNNETKAWLNQFKDDYALSDSDFEDLAIYKNGEVKFSSCTHEGFNSLDMVRED